MGALPLLFALVGGIFVIAIGDVLTNPWEFFTRMAGKVL